MNPHIALFFGWLLRASWQAAALAVLVLAAQAVFRKKLTARWRYALWLLVLARLALPVSPPSPTSIFNYARFDPLADLTPARLAPPAAPTPPRPEILPATESPPVPGPHPFFPPPTASRPQSVIPNPQSAIRNPKSSASNPVPAKPNWPVIGAALWLAGVLFLASRVLVQNALFLRRLRDAREVADVETLALLDECRALFGVAAFVPLAESAHIGSPALYGLLAPRMLLPAGLRSQLTREELRHVFLHELAHLKRRDMAVHCVSGFLHLLNWFNPVLWFAFRRMAADRELACDELALSFAGESEKRAYGQTIIKLLEHSSRPATLPGLMGILEDKNQMRRRILMIAGFKPSRRWSLLAGSLLALLAVVALTDAQVQKPNTPPPGSRSTKKDAALVNTAKPAANPSGITVEIRCAKTDLKVGDEIPIQFTVSNHGKVDFGWVEFWPEGIERAACLKLIARTATGENVPDPYLHAKNISWAFSTDRSGGSGEYLLAGDSFSWTVPLNRWAAIQEPGRYEVAGAFVADANSATPVELPASDPITITVLPRTQDEMHDYIRSLTNQLAAKYGAPPETPGPTFAELMQKLVYTCSPEIVPTLLTNVYRGGDHGGWWEDEALLYYVPRTDQVRKSMLQTAASRGLNSSMSTFLEEYGFNKEEMKPIIEAALASKDIEDDGLNYGARLAGEFYDNDFTARLIALAGNSNAPSATRSAASAALAMNRTDDGVKALKQLINDPDELTSKWAFEAVIGAYNSRGDVPGKPWRTDDFDSREAATLMLQWLDSTNVTRQWDAIYFSGVFPDDVLTAKLVALATNTASRFRTMAIGNLRFNRTDEAVKTLKTLLHDPEQQISSEAKQAICAAYRSRDGARGRPFRADDFDATEITPLIQQWLASGDRNYQYDGLDFAAIFGDDALTPKLIALATNPKPAELGFRYISIKALAMNRTDEAVATLKTLLNDPDPRISQRTEQAISRAYTSRDGALGKPLRPDDFDAKFQPPAPAPATNPAPTNNSGAIPASARDQAVAWGEPIQGLQVGLSCADLVTTSDRQPLFDVHLRNRLDRALAIPSADAFVSLPRADWPEFRSRPLSPQITPLGEGRTTYVITGGVEMRDARATRRLLGPRETVVVSNLPLSAGSFVPGQDSYGTKTSEQTYLLLADGQYRVAFVFESAQTNIEREPAWHGKAASGELTVTVRQPAPVAGLEASFQLPKTNFFVGELIYATLNLRCTNSKPVSFSDGGDFFDGRHSRYSFTAADEAGRPVADPVREPTGSGGGPGGPLTLKPGETFSDQVLVNLYLNFTNAGHYTLVCHRTLSLAGQARGGQAIEEIEVIDPQLAVETKFSINLVRDDKAHAREVEQVLAGYDGRQQEMIRAWATARDQAAFPEIEKRAKASGRYQDNFISWVAEYGEQGVPALLVAAKSSEPSCRSLALSFLSAIKSQEVPDLVEASLSSTNARERADAVLQCSKQRVPGTLDTLLAMAKDPDPLVRRYLGAALGTSGDERAVPVLLDLLHDANPDPFIRVWAAGGLSALGHKKESVPVMIDLLRTMKPSDGAGNVILELKGSTGQDLGPNPAKWIEWWEKEGTTNTTPPNPPPAVPPSSRAPSGEPPAINGTVILRAGQPAASAPNGSSTNADGVPVNSSKPATNSLVLSLEIRCTNTDLKVGDEIPIEFIIKNGGSEDYNYLQFSEVLFGLDLGCALSTNTSLGKAVGPPGFIGVNGSTANYDVLHPGESFTRVLPLNFCASMKEPGRYDVVGTYVGQRGSWDDVFGDMLGALPAEKKPSGQVGPLRSNPISVTLSPRTKEEMHDYVKSLTNQIASRLAAARQDPNRLIPPGVYDAELLELLKKLMFTYSPEMVPILLDMMYDDSTPGNGNILGSGALMGFAPHTEETRQAISQALSQRGRNGKLAYVLSSYDKTDTAEEEQRIPDPGTATNTTPANPPPAVPPSSRAPSNENSTVSRIGRPVVGKVLLPPKVANDRAQISLESTDWPATGPAQYIRARIAPNGTFRMDNVPAGEFGFQVSVNQIAVRERWTVARTIVIPEMSGGRNEPLDVGTLEPVPFTVHPPMIGETLPLFEVKTSPGGTFKLADQRGHFVLLDFEPLGSFPESASVQETWAAYGTNGRLSVLTLVVQATGNYRINAIQKEFPWPQTHLRDCP